MTEPTGSPPEHAPPKAISHAFLSERAKSYAGGIMVAAFGVLAIWEGLRHPIGTLTGMGPGFLPIVIGIVLLSLAAAVAIESRFVDQAEATETAVPSTRAALAILGALLAFAFVVGRYGVVPATFALVLISAFAQPRLKLFVPLAVATILSLIAVLVFIQGFGMSMRAFRW